MKTSKLVFALPLLISAGLQAQQAQWELVRDGLWGQIAIDPTNSNIIYVGGGYVGGGGRLDKSVDGGQTWTQYVQGYEISQIDGIVIDPNNTQRLWVYGTPIKGIVRSEDGGLTAADADNGISYDHHGFQVTGMAYDPKNDILYACNQANGFGVYRSFDGGRTWEHMSRYPYVIYADFLLVEEDSSWVYTAGGQGVLRSKDFGKTWTQLQPELLDRKELYYLASVPQSRTLYATGRFGTIFKSYDLGDNWLSISDTVTALGNFRGGLLVSAFDTSYVFVGGNGGFVNDIGGVFMSRNGGKNWQVYHTGLPEYPLAQWNVLSLAQSAKSYFLYMTVLSPFRAMNKLSQVLLTSVEERPPSFQNMNFNLQQNYPNPFNGKTKIEFSVPTAQDVTLDIYNVAGVRVSNLIKGQCTAGTHTVFWNGVDSAGFDTGSGIYLLRFQAGEEVLIRKMLLIR